MNFHSDSRILLRCPTCDTPLELYEADCVDGQTCFCSFCGAEPRLACERTADSQPVCWSLVLTDVEYADGE